MTRETEERDVTGERDLNLEIDYTLENLGVESKFRRSRRRIRAAGALSY